MRPVNPADRYFVPIVSCTIGDDEFTPENGLMEARVFLGEGERQSNCSFLVYDPEQEWADKYFKASYEAGGIEGLPPPTPPASPMSSTGGAFDSAISADTTQIPEIRAWLDTIAWAEGTSGVDGYRTQFTGAKFSGTGHPRQVLCSGVCSDAAGRYQFLSTTWDAVRSQLGLPDDMAPINQDRAAVKLIANRGVLAAAQAGLSGVDAALEELSYEWASLPPYRYRGQGTKTNADIKSYYSSKLAFYKGQPQAGGTPAAPATDNKPVKLPEPGDKKDVLSDVKLDATKEISNKGQLIKIVMGSDEGNSFEFVFTHIATSHEMHLNATEFSGASIRWEMNRRIKNTAYQDLTIRQLAQSIATNYGLKLDCPEDGPKFKYIDQTGISDYRLLQRECDRIGWRVYENGQTLVVEPRKNKQQILTLTYGKDIAKWKSEDRAQTDSVEQGRDFSQLSDRGSQGEAKTAIDTQRGEMIAEKPESKTGTGSGAIEATTGANVSPLAGLKADPPSEKKDILADVKLADAPSADSAKRVKAFKSTMECPTSEALLGATLDQPVLTDGFKADFFNRMWVVGSIEHRYDGKLSTTLQLYTPLKPKPGITLGDSKLPQGEAVAVAMGKILNPHSDGGQRGTPFDPGGAIRGRPHNGIDTVGAYPLRAGFDGKIVDVENSCTIGDYNCGGGFGNLVAIAGEGAWAGYTLWYAHLASAAVSIGQSVKAGQIIGQMGNTGASSGDHLHLELRKGSERIDPEPYISPCFTGTYGQGAGTPLKCGG